MKAIDIDENTVISILQKCWFWNEPVKPLCIKEPYIEILFCIIRYYLLDNNMKKAEMTTLYLLL